jgi:hypothetical protein
MGLLDSVLGNLMGGAGGSASPMGGVLSSLLGGSQQGNGPAGSYGRDRRRGTQRLDFAV